MVALFPLLLFCKFFVIITVVTGLIADVPSPGVMQTAAQPPRGRLLKSRLQQRRLAEPGRALHHLKRALAASGGRHHLADRRKPTFLAAAWAACHS